MRVKAILSGLVLLLCVTDSMANTDLQSIKNISQELVRIRQEIETLHNEISFEKDAYQDKLRSYSNQKSDLDVKISRADLNLKELERELKKITELNEQRSNDKSVQPVLKEAIAALRKSVATSVPFKLPQRLQALKDIEHKLDTNIISVNKAANQLWAFVEDELILGRSSGIYNDTVEIAGKDSLVKVLRIGKLAMFYKTQDNQFGVMKKQKGGWQQQTIIDKDHIAQLENLFDAFGKNIRNGIFTVPNFLPAN